MIKKTAVILLLLLLMVVLAIILLPRVPVEPEPDHGFQDFFSTYEKYVEEIKGERGEREITGGNGCSLADIVNASVRQYGVSVQIRGKTGESIELEIAQVKKKQLLEWLASLRVDHGLYIGSIKVLKSGYPGEVAVSQLVLVKASTSSIIQ
ncbi:type II secretion system protein GspM [Endozoicomonas sp. Mp262]|uniref:type II secretion system protein GspM n=1 Tax=Endozoicomonas sp. Mp262 TaxID=2919499 RepID=UPI0021D836D4